MSATAHVVSKIFESAGFPSWKGYTIECGPWPDWCASYPLDTIFVSTSVVVGCATWRIPPFAALREHSLDTCLHSIMQVLDKRNAWPALDPDSEPRGRIPASVLF